MKNFFITGGTGLVGTNLLPRLLKSFPGCTISLMIRGGTIEEARNRVRSIADEIDREYGIVDAGSRIHSVPGDISSDELGLEKGIREKLVRETTHVIHGAATIRFDHPLEEAREINCGGTRKMLSLAGDMMSRGVLERFVYIGSSSVSGQREGDIFEDDLEKGQQFFNTYEHSKCESERLVRSVADTIPIVIFRPSIIIGDSKTGKTTSFNVIYIPLRLLHKGLLTYVPGTPETTLDLVPIDWVADSMAYILNREESVGKVFHQTAGPHRAAKLAEVVLLATEYFDRHDPLKRPRVMQFISRGEFERRRSEMQGREEALMGQLDTLLPYVSVNRLFDSRNTDEILEGSGITFPLFKDYYEKIFEFCLRTNWGKKFD
jgi:long-chain acyl-CoA synthetase